MVWLCTVGFNEKTSPSTIQGFFKDKTSGIITKT